MCKKTALSSLKCSAAIAGLFLCIAVPAQQNDRWLVPSPKEVQWKKEALTYPSSGYCLSDETGMVQQETLQWLKDGLQQKLGWKECPKSNVCIRIRKSAGNGNQEYYILKTGKAGITIEAPEQAGVFRAIGRLLCIADTPLVRVHADGTVQYPGLVIHDWPDYPFRGMLLELSCRAASPKWLPNLKQMIDAMGKLGFNHAAFEIGGRIESLRYPEICKKPWWTQKQIKDLIAYANARGMKVIPAINSIGHFERAPEIFPLKYTRKNGKTTYAMNLAHPEFYSVYFGFLNEIHALFGKPAYFMIGTDEFNEAVPLLEKTTGKPLPVFYSEFLNKVYGHLKEKGTRTVIWHDMLADKSTLYGEALNGSAKTMDLISRDIVVAYWCYGYGYGGEYSFLKSLYGKKFKEIWVSPWKGIGQTAKLALDGKKLGGHHLMGTCWWDRPHYLGFPETAESAWNTETHRPQIEMDAFKDLLFYAETTKKPLQNYMQLDKIQGGQVPYAEFISHLRKTFPTGWMPLDNFSLKLNPYAFSTQDAVPAEIPHPWNFKELLSNGSLDQVLMHTESSREWVTPKIVKMNTSRGTNELIIYTPEFGKTTKTNTYGIEFALINGIITDVAKLYPRGNMSIPPDGTVFSRHASYSSLDHSMNFYSTLRKGERLILRRQPGKNPPLQPLAIPLEGTSRFILFFTTAYPMSEGKKLARIQLIPMAGNAFSSSLDTGNFFNGHFNPGSPWQMWLPYPTGMHTKLGPILAVKWNPEKATALKKVKIIPEENAAISGLVFLGGIKY